MIGRLLMCWMGALLLSTGSVAAQATTWRVCITDVDAPPYLHNDPQHPGVVERLLKDAGQKLGLQTEFLRFPPRRCVQMFEQGQIEATLASPTPTNLLLGLFPMKSGEVDRSLRLAHVRLMWAKRAASAIEWDGRRMQGAEHADLLVATRPAHGVAIEALQQQGFRVDSSGFNTRQLLAKLQASRVDLVLGIEEDLRHALRTPQGLILLPQPFAAVDYYVILAHRLTPAERELGARWWQEIGRRRDLPAYRPG